MEERFRSETHPKYSYKILVDVYQTLNQFWRGLTNYAGGTGFQALYMYIHHRYFSWGMISRNVGKT